MMHRVRWISVLATALFLALSTAQFAKSQESAQPSASPSNPVAHSKRGKQKYSRANDFLLHGTVFNEQALSFPAVEVRIRRANVKKFRWRTLTNSRGEFAVRVPQGAQYQIVVHAKGFADQERSVDAHGEAGEQNLVFHMQHAAGGTK